ncbi:C-factor-like [Patiria miniata]|uniref:C-factor n=1 Tax=Patiria miniata TaxID=46514 RepID=A0A914ARN3_PATMI|nr:C-factor-like [Patiria miniata]
MFSVLVTGASRGIGLEYVRQLLALSSPPQHVFACCRSPVNAEDLQGIAMENPSVKVLQIDVTKEDDFPAAVREVDGVVGERGLTVLINNAAIFSGHTCETTLAFLPALKRAAALTSSDDTTMSMQTAAVVNMSSVMGSLASTKNGKSASYRMTKVAVNMLTVCMAHDFASYGILAVAMHPGLVNTDMGKRHAGKLSPKESVCGILDTLLKLRGRQASGKAYQWNGQILAW